MTNFQAFILGIVQGVTEYLPVSSSAHLVLVPEFLGWDIHGKEAFIFDVLVQLGTLLGVLLYFAKDLLKISLAFLKGLVTLKPFDSDDSKMGWFVIFATIPATIIGLLFKDHIEQFFDSPRAALFFLLITTLLLLSAEYLSSKERSAVIQKDAWYMGLAQSLALFPGISRSGSTISIGMLRGLSREAAAKFSFLMSIPVMLGASLLAVKDLLENEAILEALFYPILVGFFAAATSGYIVIAWFLKFLKTQSLNWFAGYCLFIIVVGMFAFQ